EFVVDVAARQVVEYHDVVPQVAQMKAGGPAAETVTAEYEDFHRSSRTSEHTTRPQALAAAAPRRPRSVPHPGTSASPRVGCDQRSTFPRGTSDLTNRRQRRRIRLRRYPTAPARQSPGASHDQITAVAMMNGWSSAQASATPPPRSGLPNWRAPT